MEQVLLFLTLQAFPESIVITYVCFKLLKRNVEWSKILTISLLETISNIVHFLPIAFGMHTIILPFTQALYIRIITKERLSKIFIPVAICLVVIVISEGFYSNPMLDLLNMEFQEVRENPLLTALFSIPGYIALLLIPVIQKIYILWRNKKINYYR